MPSLTIPGTIKTQYSPFLLDPKGGTSAQQFSFRKNLNICPTVVKENFSKDIAHMLTYGPGTSKDSLTFNTLLNDIPGIQIREFLPDTKLDQTINFFGEIIDKVKDMWSDKDKKKEGEAQVDSQTDGVFAKIKNILNYAFDYFTGAKSVSIVSSLGALNSTSNTTSKMGSSKENQYILTFPYTMYYRLQSCTTTNVYELPCVLSDNRVASSDGTPGWDVGAGFRVGGLLTKVPVIGDVLKNILGNIGVNYTPWWDAEKGVVTPEPEVEVTFDLFNDTAEAAMMNFIFVNTIVPNNKWLQYCMFQHSSNLYDVKIEGLNRLFACSAKFTVTSMGVLRSPPQSWLDTLYQRHYNYNGKPLTSREIKIPDIYHVTMTFNSLLPANFNNFIFSYSENMNITNPGKNNYQNGMLAKLVGQITGDFTDDMTGFISKGCPSTWS